LPSNSFLPSKFVCYHGNITLTTVIVKISE